MAEAGSRRPASDLSASGNVWKLTRGPDAETSDMYEAQDVTNKLRKELEAKGLKGFKKGGKVRKTGVYKLHKGEKVVPANKVRSQSARDIAMLKRTRFR